MNLRWRYALRFARLFVDLLLLTMATPMGVFAIGGCRNACWYYLTVWVLIEWAESSQLPTQDSLPTKHPHLHNILTYTKSLERRLS